MDSEMRPVERDTWPIARFPSSGQREEFLSVIRLWNRLEDLPTIEVEALNNGVTVRLRCLGGADRGIRRLVDSYGGSVREGHGRHPRAAA